MSEVGIPGANEAMNEVPQVLGRADTGATQTFAAQDREPDLHLVEPRAMSGQPVESDLGALGGAPVQDGLFLMITGVVHTQMPAPVRVAGAPLDNNVAERALKLCIRQRKNSLFYATEHSAYIASILTSII